VFLNLGDVHPTFFDAKIARGKSMLQTTNVDLDVMSDWMPRRQVFRFDLSATAWAIEFQYSDPLGIWGKGEFRFNHSGMHRAWITFVD
jgi:hypothetical protein